MSPEQGLFYGLLGFTIYAIRRFISSLPKKQQGNILNWSSYSKEYLEALSQLDKDFPTGDPSELSLKQYLEAQELRARSWNSIGSSWNTLYAPGLSAALGGGALGALGQLRGQQQALQGQQQNDLQNMFAQQQGVGCPPPQLTREQEMIAQLLGKPKNRS